MTNLRLSTEEQNQLIKVLDMYLSNLWMEIADTDSSFFKKDLKDEKKLITELLEKLREKSETLSA